MLQILFAVGVTFIVTNAVPSGTINPIKLLPKAKESTLASAQAKSLLNLQSSAQRLKQDSIVAPPQDYLVELVDKSVAVQKYDLTLGEMLVPNILAQQAIDALKQESAAVFKLDSISSSALKYLVPPLDDLKSEQDGMRSSLDLLKESDAEPVKTILYLWESDEYTKLGSKFSQYGEETRTGNDEENDDNNSYDDTK